MKIRHSILTALLLFATASLNGDPIPRIALSAKTADALDLDGRASRFFAGDEGPTLTPFPEQANIILEDAKNVRTNIGVEALFRKRLSTDEEHMLTYANLLLAFSSLKGTTYFSASRDRDRLLFEESHTMRLSDVEHHKRGEIPERVSDLHITSLPSTKVATIFQKDLTFGGSIYSAHVNASHDVIHLTLENLTPFRYGPIRLIKSHNMRLHVFLVRDDEFLYYYSVFIARSIRFAVLDDKIYSSFYNRIAALYDWFDEAADAS